jgi:cyclopropane fatty-acyl-phospholipid synthase-like methyltransferase
MRVENRYNRILKLVVGKEVLDLGCTWVDDDGTWIHGKMLEVAKSVTGMDIDGVEELQQRGYDIIYQSVDEPYDLQRRFDVIVAAEVLDHVCNLGTFMDNAKRHLRNDGILVVTMHNPQAFEFFIEQLVFRGSLRIREHMHWQNENTMANLLEKHGMRLKYKEYYHYKAFSSIGKLYDILTFPLPNIFSRCILYVAEHNDR